MSVSNQISLNFALILVTLTRKSKIAKRIQENAKFESFMQTINVRSGIVLSPAAERTEDGAKVSRTVKH